MAPFDPVPFEAELRSIASWWATRAVDRQHGGFHGQLDQHGNAVAGASKSAILQTRILWFFSEFGQRHPSEETWIHLSQRAFETLLAWFVDRTDGGLFWHVDPAGRVLDGRKQTYAQAFGIYASCAYYRFQRSADARDLAYSLFHCVESQTWDQHGSGGYLEAHDRGWRPLRDQRLSAKDQNQPKTMNTHLHVLEAYAALHTTFGCDESAAALRRIIVLFLERFVDRSAFRLRLFFERDWTDRTRARSYGHEIEFSWLLWEACLALEDLLLQATCRPLVLGTARRCLRDAWDPRGYLWEERSFEVQPAPTASSWWVQAEALVGTLNAYQLDPDPEFLQAFEATWAFVRQQHLGDPGGEWRWHDRDHNPRPVPYRAGPWKGPYHNGRAMMEVVDRLRRLDPVSGLNP